MKKQVAYTDSSYSDKDGVAGIGVVIDKGVKLSPMSNWIPCLDNNYAELFAIYVAGIMMGGSGVVYTDSQCAIDYLEGKVREDKPRTHQQYIKHQQRKVLAYKIKKLNIEVRKVKAHTRNFKLEELNNNDADIQAKRGLAKFYARKLHER